MTRNDRRVAILTRGSQGIGADQTQVYPADSYEGLGDRLPPLGRVGQVSDVVDAILFLESSPYITGEILHVDGGQTAGR